jgi:hypothetical protein
MNPKCWLHFTIFCATYHKNLHYQHTIPIELEPALEPFSPTVSSGNTHIYLGYILTDTDFRHYGAGIVQHVCDNRKKVKSPVTIIKFHTALLGIFFGMLPCRARIFFCWRLRFLTNLGGIYCNSARSRGRCSAYWLFFFDVPLFQNKLVFPRGFRSEDLRAELGKGDTRMKDCEKRANRLSMFEIGFEIGNWGLVNRLLAYRSAFCSRE